MSGIEAVIFDLGNVLAFHDNAYLYRRLGERAGLNGEAVAEALADPRLFDGTNRGTLDAAGIHREVSRAIGLDAGRDEFTALWNCHFTLNESILPLVEGLIGRVKLLLLSNTNVIHTAYLRPRLPVLDRFDHLLFSHDLGLVKPEPAFYRAALERAGVAPETAAFFDDVPAYVEAASALGIRGHIFRDTNEFAGQLREMGLLTGG